MLKKALVAFGAALLGGSLSLTAANAAPAGNVVVLGDSFTSNPDQVRSFTRDIPIPAYQDWVWDYPNTEGCLQSPDNWPRQVAQQTGMDVADWSCTAMTSNSMADRMERAIASGDLNKDTRTLVMGVGGNDFFFEGVLDGNNPLDPAGTADKYRERMQHAADRAREINPNIKLVVAGLPSIMEQSRSQLCFVNVVPNLPAGPFIPFAYDSEMSLNDIQRNVAGDIGADFVDFKAGTAAHHSCAPDAERWIAGAIDTTTPGLRMGFHPTVAGQHYMAEEIAPHL